MTNDELLAEIDRGRAEFDAAAAEVGKGRWTEPIFDDGWSLKDVLVHLSTWEKIAMAVIRNDGFPGPPPEEGEIESGGRADEINAKVYADNRDRPLDDVVADAQRTHGELREFVAALPEGRLDQHIGGDEQAPLVRRMLAGNSHEHYREHVGWIRAALAKP